MRVELLNIGTELLMGFVLNTHAAWLGQKLSGIGATLVRQTCVNDTAADIRQALEEALGRADLVITTGGLGPTSDDITRSIVVEMLGLKTHVDERVMNNIRERFRRRSVEMPPSVASQAVVPDAAIVLHNPHGTAPGLAIPLSRPRAAELLVMLPGPPREMRPMFETHVLPLLWERFGARFVLQDCRVFKVAGMGESSVEERVDPALRGIPGLEIGYCARSGEVDVRLVVRGTVKEEVARHAAEAERRTRAALGDAVFGAGEISLEQVVVGLLRERKRSLAVAESCTGGCVAHRITLVPGSSEVFREGWVTYANESKSARLGVPAALFREEGSVSEAVARAMAEGALREAGVDDALALTGIAGPGGGTPEKPAGTVFIALASRDAAAECERFCFHLDRETFKFMASQTALNMLRKRLLRVSSKSP